MLKYLYLIITCTLNVINGNDNLKSIFTTVCVEGSLDILHDLNLLNTDTQGKLIEDNARKKINELAQYHNMEIRYTKDSQEGPSHKPTFTVTLTLGDETYQGQGSNLKLAKENAASLALSSTRYDTPVKIKNKLEKTPVQELYELRDKLGFHLDFYLIDTQLSPNLRVIKLEETKRNISFWEGGILKLEDRSLMSPFTVESSVEEYSFYGKDHTVKGAKQRAAQEAVWAINNQSVQIGYCYRNGKSKVCSNLKEQNKSPASLIQEASTRYRLNLNYKQTDVTGPPHRPVFTFECNLGDFKTSAEGPSKKKAKQNAARKMMENLQYLSESNELETEQSKPKNKNRGFLNSVTDQLNNFFGSEDKNDEKPDQKSKKSPKNKKTTTAYKQQLLEMGDVLKINFQFSNINQKGIYYSVISMNTKPSYICLGEGVNLKSAEEAASLNTMEFIKSLAITDSKSNNVFIERSEIQTNSLYGKEEIISKKL